MLPDDLIECGVLKRTCPKCGHETIDDWEMMALHLEQCAVNCKTCVDKARSMLDKTGRCYLCGGYGKWRGRTK